MTFIDYQTFDGFCFVRLIGVRSCTTKNNKTQGMLIFRHLGCLKISYCVIKCHELQKKGERTLPLNRCCNLRLNYNQSLLKKVVHAYNGTFCIHCWSR